MKKSSSAKKSNAAAGMSGKSAAKNYNYKKSKLNSKGTVVKSASGKAPADPKRKKKVIAAVITLVAIAVLYIVGYFYYRRSTYYQEHFYTGTVINGVDCSDMTEDQAKATIQARLNDYTFTFTDHEGIATTVTAPELEVTYRDDGGVTDLLKAQNPILWAFRNNKEGNYQVTSGYTYSEEKLRGWTGMLPCVTDGVAPTDAYEYQNEEGYWEIEPETYGDKVDEEALYGIIKSAVDNAVPDANLEGTDIFLKPAVTADEAMTASVEEKNAAIRRAEKIAQITEEITGVELLFSSYVDKIYINSKLLSDMLTEDEEGMPMLDEKKLREWVRNWATSRGFDQNPNLFVTHGGKLMEVGDGIIGGWAMDLDATVDKAVEEVMTQQSGVFYPVLKDDSGKLQSETSYVEINILKQTMWYYEDGEELVGTPIVTGDHMKGMDTPTNGVWYIYQKLTNYTMRGPVLSDGSYEYITYVNYWMPFNDQIGIHDMQSRDAFGGDIYQGHGSHGCVNTPYEAVETIFEHAVIGTPVVVHS